MSIQLSRIVSLEAKILVGQKISMSLAANRTFELWRSFMQRRKEITSVTGTELYSVQVYRPEFDFSRFAPDTIFEKWAAVEVSAVEDLPSGMNSLQLAGGLYAVFDYKGRPADFAPAFRYIFSEWLPASGYTVDQRPHFEVLGAKYRNDDPGSEEEIWVPLRKP